MRLWIPLSLLALTACGGASKATHTSTTPDKATTEPAATVAEPAAEAATPALPPRKDDAGRNSKNGRAEGEIGGAEVIVTYGRPSRKGRTLFGELIPHGKIWRTGADEATVLSVSKDVTVAGEPLKAGVYGLFAIPGEKEWTIVVNQVANQWGAYDYDAAKDVLRATVPVTAHDETEVFTIDVTGEGLSMLWGTTAVKVPISG